MKRILKWVGIVLGAIAVFLLGFYLWASSAASSMLAETYEAEGTDFPIPFPLTESELERLRERRGAELSAQADADAESEEAESEETESEEEPSEGEGEAETPAQAPAEPERDPLEGVDLDALATERALERGRHLVNARYGCTECHGDDFGGGTMIDEMPIARLFGPNLTSGEGGVVSEYTAADWDRAVRHGILPDGRPSAMPSEDYQRMSDQELSDIIVYIRSFDPVDRTMDPPELGTMGKILMATGNIPLSATLIDHDAEHARFPPATEPTAEFGEHLAGVCTGCHRGNLAGGPIKAGPPDWVPAANLTPHADGLEGWTYDDFVTAMRDMKRPDGSELRLPMTLIASATENMTDVELQAMWAYLESVDPLPTNE